MNKDKIDDIVDALSDTFSKIENTFLIKNNQQLVKYLENPEQWKANQLKNQKAYKSQLIKDARQQLASLNAKAEKVFLLSYQEVAKDQIEITEKEIVAKNIPNSLRSQIIARQKINTEEMAKLVSNAYQTYTKTVNLVSALSTPSTLFDVVKDQMKKGINNGIKVTYSDGKQVSWKSYMEMNIRTTVHQEITNQQVEVGSKIGQIFYLCDSFGDCAPDHADYQGKLYYNEGVNIPNEVQAFIDSNNIMSMQEVMNGDPFLTTRPNCRHNFHAISLEEAMGSSADEILKKEGLKFGDYEADNYSKVREQRYNERQIRKYKTQVENNKQLGQTTGVKGILPSTMANEKVKEYQARNRELAKANPDVIKRNYEREKANIIVNDLGVRYKYKVVDGELERK